MEKEKKEKDKQDKDRLEQEKLQKGPTGPTGNTGCTFERVVLSIYYFDIICNINDIELQKYDGEGVLRRNSS